jgi:hypothetical protein
MRDLIGDILTTGLITLAVGVIVIAFFIWRVSVVGLCAVDHQPWTLLGQAPAVTTELSCG